MVTRRLENGSYSGRLGLLEQHKTDLALGPYALTLDRLATFRPSAAFLMDSAKLHMRCGSGTLLLPAWHHRVVILSLLLASLAAMALAQTALSTLLEKDGAITSPRQGRRPCCKFCSGDVTIHT
ncbi:hypothetical protein ONE63_003559 [Megalurothrips usitatus]|uniref:Uncharacterized protein n=1 Tax=Megalurothrips usitatus TaxID=439358 RepID=A0AAV7X6V6_9NEOP|nr:hypothetical protein ONE63_003559 [Megalurothrips usitatus]